MMVIVQLPIAPLNRSAQAAPTTATIRATGRRRWRHREVDRADAARDRPVGRGPHADAAEAARRQRQLRERREEVGEERRSLVEAVQPRRAERGDPEDDHHQEHGEPVEELEDVGAPRAAERHAVDAATDPGQGGREGEDSYGSVAGPAVHAQRCARGGTVLHGQEALAELRSPHGDDEQDQDDEGHRPCDELRCLGIECERTDAEGREVERARAEGGVGMPEEVEGWEHEHPVVHGDGESRRGQCEVDAREPQGGDADDDTDHRAHPGCRE